MENLKAELLARGLAPRSAQIYEQVLRRAQRWCEGQGQGYDLSSVPPTALIEWVQTERRTFASRKHVRQALRHYWAIAGRQDSPPTVTLPPKPRMECKALEDREAGILARAAALRNDERGLAVLLGFYLALRREEIASLRWDVFRPDWTEAYIVGKRGVSAWVRVHPWMGDRLSLWEQRGPWVFPSKRKGYEHVGASTIWHWTRAVAREAGLSPVAPHVLRHTSLAQANDATGDLRTVQQFARHADPQVTSGYTRVTQERLTAVVMSLDFMHVHGKKAADRPPPVVGGQGRRVA